MDTLDAGLMLVFWVLVGALIAVAYRIARFYQITSGRRTYYRLFAVPLALFPIAALFDAAAEPLLQALRDVLLLVGSVSLIGLGYYLLHLMIGSRS